MNEDANVRIVQEGYEAFNSGDIPRLLGLFADDIKWTGPKVEHAPFANAHNGVNEVGDFFGKLAEAEDFSRFEPLEYIAQADKVVVLGELAATVKSTGRSYESDWVHIFHMKDGKVAEFTEFFDTAAADRAFQKAANA